MKIHCFILLFCCFIFLSISCGQGSSLTSNTSTSLAAISITPSMPKVALNGTIKFEAFGYSSKGTAVNFTPAWTVEGNIGTIVRSETTTAVFTAKSAGEGKVIASSDGVSNSVPTTVTSGNLSSIVINPSFAAVYAGKTQPFTASGKDANGATVDIIPSWSVEGGIGSIDDNGLFLAGLVTIQVSGKVTASVASIKGEASVTAMPSAF